MNTYQEIIEKKRKIHILSGFDVSISELPDTLFDFQKFCVRRALKAGKYALFEDCGLGKTRQQIIWAKYVCNYTNGQVLILAPLAVVGQTIKEGDVINIRVHEYGSGDIQIANYEQIDNIDLSIFSGIVLDESSILKNFEGAYRNALISGCKNIPYKLCCTATPSPNDPMELGNHAEFLDVMSRNEMLAMYFVHDGGETAKWRIKGHCENIFWQFVSQWSIMLCKPDDIGFHVDGYHLPSLEFIERKIITPTKAGSLFNMASVSATTFNQELRITKTQRIGEVVSIVNNSDESFIIWIKHNEEGELLRKLIPGSIEVSGNDSNDVKKERLLGFADNKFRVLITKLKIGSLGLNYQNCHNQVFASLDFSFEGLYQGIRRSYRFGQQHTVNIWLITTDTMENVILSIQKKQVQFEKMQQKMANNINMEYNKTIKQNYMYEFYEASEFKIEHGDCVNLIKNVPDESIGFSIFSPPFAELYTYSDAIEDMGNSKNYNEFFEQFNFLVKELYRVLWSGRNIAVHCMDLPIQKGKEGYIGLRDFSGMILQSFQNAGFIYHSRVTIWKNPVTEMQRTKALGLLHKQIKKDAAMSRVGIPDYLLVFRKPGESSHPIAHTDLPVDMWQKYASPVWMDIDYGNTLNARSGRDEKDEKHICPLQLDTIDRAIHLWSNEGDIILTPFAGIGSELYGAIKRSRKGVGFELKKSYYDEAVKNCLSLIEESKQVKLF
jgi:DNA modification methylase